MSGTRTRMELFSTMPDSGNTVYMRFDKAPAGLPVNLYLDFEGKRTFLSHLSSPIIPAVRTEAGASCAQ